jgi:hypothetical protein
VIGSVRNGRDVHLVVQPGQHRLRLRVVGKYSPELTIVSVADEVAAFECGPAGSTLSALYLSIFKRNGYITLRRAL